MASIVSAIDYVLHQEDGGMLGRVSNDRRDSGGRTRYGIAERFHPEMNQLDYFDEQKCSAAVALELARVAYARWYQKPLCIDGISQQNVANALLSFAVNEGTATSIKVLQTTLGLNVDGVMGPVTLQAVNSTGDLLAKLEAEQTAHYRAIVAANPKDAAFLNGWINRVKQDCSA